MQIKQVEIVGFKSFVDRVSLEFGPGIAAVVGPNGCGKSNIVDALRWVMGEQSPKNLRGRAMEDIIFGGSERRRPLGMAEVSLIFSNEQGLGPAAVRDYAEFMVTRRLYRNGESEYLFNKKPCRLLDITELFMDTGIGARAYSIIEQGKIGMLLNAKPEDRRFLIEEAAGVSKFKARKKTALRKIEATRHNLLRLQDIIGEVRRQLAGLKRQARKAETFRGLREEQRQIELCFAQVRFAELADECREQTVREQSLSMQLAGLEGQLAAAELCLEQQRLQQTAEEQELGLVQERVFQFSSQLQRLELQRDNDARELQSLAGQQERLAEEQQEIQERLRAAVVEEKDLRSSSASLVEEGEEQANRLMREEAELAEWSGREEADAACLEENRRRLMTMVSDVNRLRLRREDIERRRRSVDERLAHQRREAVRLGEQQAELARQAEAHGQTLDSLEIGMAAANGLLQEALEALAVGRRRLEDNEQVLLLARQELGACRTRLESLQQLERNLEGYGPGVRQLLADESLRGRLQGMTADILEVPARYEVAVEAALGERLQALIAADAEAARAALAALRRSGSRGLLLLRNRDCQAPLPPVVGRPLVDLIVPRPGAEALVRDLLSGVCLVEDLAACFEQSLPVGAMLVTAEGETLCHRGILIGGGAAGGGHGLLSKKREIKELAALLEQLEERAAQLHQERLALKEAHGLAEHSQAEAAAEIQRLALRRTEAEQLLSAARRALAQLAERLEVLTLEDDQADEEYRMLQKQHAEVVEGLHGQETARAEAEMQAEQLQEALLLSRRRQSERRERATAIKVELAGLREREESCRRNLQRLVELQQDLQRRQHLNEQRQAELQRQRDELGRAGQRRLVEMELLASRRDEEQLLLSRRKEQHGLLQSRLEAAEEALKEQRRAVQKLRDAVADLLLCRRQSQLEYEHLHRTVLERYRFDLQQEALSLDEFQAATAEGRLQDLVRQIEEMGEVNLTAIDEFRELEGRWQFLCTQEQDLQQSLEGLQEAIAKINHTTRRRFRETFDLVNQQFQAIFPRLFLGGRAELVLTDEHDLLETGIEIVVQPPGKRLQSVGLLSGGEKALTAIALVFAIFLIKPSPFCVLDEVDAPLDEANIYRFNEMVREMSECSQFIIITHNKRTMEMADTLYGVTMEEPGVSKLVSVRMNDS